MTSLGTRRTDSGGRLAREWARLRTRPNHLATANSWQLVDRPIHDLDDVLSAVGYGCASTPATEARLVALVLLAAHDDLAARVVVQRILPGLLAVVRRRRGKSANVCEELLGAAWIAIRTYNPARAPRSIAAALISDADYNAFRASDRRRSSHERPGAADFERRADEHEPTSCEQLADVLADAAAAGVASEDLDLVRQLLATKTANELARVLQITPRTIRNRRARITSRLREVALVA